MPWSVPTQPGASTHQEREIESIPIRHVNAAQRLGIRGRAPAGRPGAVGWPCGHDLQESWSFLFPVLGSLGASLLARGSQWEEAVGCAVLCGWGRSYVSCGDAGRSQPGRPEGSCRGQRICRGDVRPLCHAPTFLAGGGPPGWWEVAGVSLHLGFRSQESDFKGALLILKLKWESVPQFSESLPHSASHGCL